SNSHVTQFPSPSKEVDDRVDALRGHGHVAPSNLIFIPLNFSNPFTNTSTTVTYSAVINTGSAWNVATLSLVTQLALPLGSECEIDWGGLQK
ncbi:MAG: hypothetical protein K2Y18_09030, partial [Alphaproteobacteria bacterium]|nr:hypothetical protein [Alphaproteobacteria bacterium]